jgi:hypothetical protein
VVPVGSSTATDKVTMDTAPSSERLVQPVASAAVVSIGVVPSTK